MNEFVYYVEEDSFQDKKINYLNERMEDNRQRNNLFIDVKNYPKKPRVFFLDSKTKLKVLTGLEGNGYADTKAGAVFMVYSPDTDAVTPHELFHLYSWKIWGTPKLNFLNEGMAVYVGKYWQSIDLHGLSKYLKDKRSLISFSSQNLWRSENHLVAYPQSGSFVKFLSENYGKEKIQSIWQKKAKDFKKVFGKDLTELENEWLVFLDTQDSSGINYQVKF